VLVGYIGAKDDGGGGDNWSYKLCNKPTPNFLSINKSV